MNDSVLAKYTGVRSEQAAAPPAPDNDGTETIGCFGWLRGVKDRAIMLELRHCDGKVSAYGYAWLERAEFDASDGITLHFAGKQVKITGRNLNAECRPNVRLFNGIVRHRVPWLQEADRAMELASPKEATLIDGLETG